MSILDGTTGEKAMDTEKAIEMDAMKAEIARLKAENEALTTKHTGHGIPVLVKANGFEKEYSLGIKHGDKGVVSVFGMGRFPISAYPMQWLALIGIGEQIKGYIKANAEELSWEKAAK